MQNKLFNTLLGAGIATIVGGAITLTPAISQTVKATLVQNVDEPARNPYQEQRMGPGIIAFTPVPAGKRLVITHASAITNSGSATEADPLLIEGEGYGKFGLPVQEFLPSVAQQGGKTYVVSSDLKMYFEAGQYPRAGFDSSYNARVCLYGYYIDLP